MIGAPDGTSRKLIVTTSASKRGGDPRLTGTGSRQRLYPAPQSERRFFRLLFVLGKPR